MKYRTRINYANGHVGAGVFDTYNLARVAVKEARSTGAEITKSSIDCVYEHSLEPAIRANNAIGAGLIITAVFSVIAIVGSLLALIIF